MGVIRAHTVTESCQMFRRGVGSKGRLGVTSGHFIRLGSSPLTPNLISSSLRTHPGRPRPHPFVLGTDPGLKGRVDPRHTPHWTYHSPTSPSIVVEKKVHQEKT